LVLLAFVSVFFVAKEARRKKNPTAHPNSRNYARCEWKCL